MEVIGDPVLEPGGRADLPLGELLLQPIASDLAQRLRAGTKKKGGEIRPKRSQIARIRRIGEREEGVE